jgi:hypothetical protein
VPQVVQAAVRLTEVWVLKRVTTIATTVRELQLVDGELAETEHGFSIDVVCHA